MRYPDPVENDQPRDRGRRDGTRFARRGSARLAYVVVGGAQAAAAPVVALHDLLADRSAWGTLQGAVGGLGVGMVLPDARGHGASAAVAGRRFGLGELADDVAAVLGAEGVEGAHLVGHGLGGATALAFAGRYPGRARSLVVVEPALPGLLGEGGEAEARWVAGQARERLRVAADLAEKGSTEWALDAYLEPRLGAGWREGVPRARLGAIRRHAAALGPLLAALDDPWPDAAIVGGVRAPMLVVRGEGAAPLDRLVADRLLGLAAGSRLTVVPGAVDAFDPAGGEGGGELLRRVAAFLAEQAGGGSGDAGG